MQAPAGSFHTASWPEALALVAGAAAVKAQVNDAMLGHDQPPASPAGQEQATEQWRLKVAGLQTMVDDGLWRSLKDALLLCGDVVSRHPLAHTPTSRCQGLCG